MSQPFDPDSASPRDAARSGEARPFELTVEGMHCGACVRRVKAALAAVDGVTVDEVVVGRVRGALDGAEPAAVIAAIEDAGFKAKAADAVAS
jgi:copper chaperone